MYKRWSTNREAPCAYTQQERNRLPCRNCLSWMVKLCKLLNQNLTRRATESNERQSRLTVFNLLEGLMERFFVVASIGWFLRNNPLSSKIVHTSQFFASVKLQQPTIFQKWLHQALHCPSYSMLVTRSLQIHRH